MRSIVNSIAILVVLFSAVFTANKALQEKIIDKSLTLNQDTQHIIFGDSHGVCSFNPNHIKNAQNFSNYGESLVLTYYKLKHILESNQSRKGLNIILAFSQHAIYHCRENYNDPKQRTKIIQEYYPLLDDPGLDLVGKHGMEYYLTQLKYDFGVPFLFKETLDNYLSKRSSFITGYWNTRKSKNVNLKHSMAKLEDHYNNESNPTPSSTLLTYLDKIIDLAERNNLTITLVNTPKHQLYFSNALPNSVSIYYNELTQSLSLKTNVHYIDLSTTMVGEDSYFRDTDHLNSDGATVFSMKLDAHLQKIFK